MTIKCKYQDIKDIFEWSEKYADGREQELIDYIGDVWDLDFAEVAECEVLNGAKQLLVKRLGGEN